MQEARYYHTLADGRVQCDLCPHGCTLVDGQHGRCHNRANHGGRLYSEVYGHPCALADDPIEKKPLLHFMPGTHCLSLSCTGCNLRCRNCQNYQISQSAPIDIKEYPPMSPQAIVDLCIRLPTIAYTYTEPLTYIEYIIDIARLARQQGKRNVLVSAGYVNAKPLTDLLPYLDAANIDLKVFSDDIYRHHCGASLQPVLNTLTAIHQSGVWLEITHLLIPTINDDENMFRRMCQWLVSNKFAMTPLHITRFFPLYRMRNLYPTPLATMRRFSDIAGEEGITTVHLGNV